MARCRDQRKMGEYLSLRRSQLPFDSSFPADRIDLAALLFVESRAPTAENLLIL